MKKELSLLLLLSIYSSNNIIGMNNDSESNSTPSTKTHATPDKDTHTNLTRRYSETTQRIITSRKNKNIPSDISDPVKTFCTVHAARCLDLLETEQAKISITDLAGPFMRRLKEATHALRELATYKKEKEAPATNMRIRALSDSQKRTLMRHKIWQEQLMQQEIQKKNEEIKETLTQDTISSEKKEKPEVSSRAWVLDQYPDLDPNFVDEFETDSDLENALKTSSNSSSDSNSSSSLSSMSDSE